MDFLRRTRKTSKSERQAEINTAVENAREEPLNYIDAAVLFNCSISKAMGILRVAARQAEDLEYHRGELRKK